MSFSYSWTLSGCSAERSVFFAISFMDELPSANADDVTWGPCLNKQARQHHGSNNEKGFHFKRGWVNL